MSALPALLQELETAWARLGLPESLRLAPGLAKADVVAALKDAGLPVNDEIVEWFHWHNGKAVGNSVVLAPSGFDALSLQEALNHWQNSLTLVEAAPWSGESPSYWWGDCWLPIGLNTGAVFLAADLADGNAVRSVVWDGDDFRTVLAESLSQMVQIWLDALATGIWSWGDEPQEWVYDWNSLSLEQRQNGLLN